MLAAVMTKLAFTVSAILPGITIGGRLRRRCHCAFPLATLDELVEFAAIKPDAAAFRAIIDLDILPLGHYQLGFLAYRAFHGNSPHVFTQLGRYNVCGQAERPLSWHY